MVKKKRVKKTRRPGKIVSKMPNIGSKINMVFRKLIFFMIFFVLFLVLYLVVSNELWNYFLGIAALLFGFICAGLLIVLLILWFLQLMKKK